MQSSIKNLRSIASSIRAGMPLDREVASWFGECLDAFLQRRCTSIEEAAGLIFPRGGVPWWREEAIRERDAALRRLAAGHLGDLTPTAQARQILSMSQRYAASAWRFDRCGSAMPTHYRGSAKAELWAAFASGAAMPIGERQLRKILGR